MNAFRLGAVGCVAMGLVACASTPTSATAGFPAGRYASGDDVLISFFVQGAGFEILPLRIYSMVKLGVKPDINALSTIMFVVTVVLVLAAQILLKTRRQ